MEEEGTQNLAMENHGRCYTKHFLRLMIIQEAKKCHFWSITEVSMRRGVSAPSMVGIYGGKEVSLFTGQISHFSRGQKR